MKLTEHLFATSVSTPLFLDPLHRLHTRLSGLVGDTPLVVKPLSFLGPDLTLDDEEEAGAWQVLSQTGTPLGYALPEPNRGLSQAKILLSAAGPQGDYDTVFPGYLLTVLPQPTTYLQGDDLEQIQFLNAALHVPAGACPSPYQLRALSGDTPPRMAWPVAGFLLHPKGVEWFPSLSAGMGDDW